MPTVGVHCIVFCFAVQYLVHIDEYFHKHSQQGTTKRLTILRQIVFELKRILTKLIELLWLYEFFTHFFIINGIYNHSRIYFLKYKNKQSIIVLFFLSCIGWNIKKNTTTTVTYCWPKGINELDINDKHVLGPNKKYYYCISKRYISLICKLKKCNVKNQYKVQCKFVWSSLWNFPIAASGN